MKNTRLVRGALLGAVALCSLLSTQPSRAIAACGDAVVDLGEECDDGNVDDLDFCSSTCRSELVPGSNGRGASECLQEWMTEPIAPVSTGGKDLTITCQDDSPLCDFGPIPGDAACTFHVRMCFNLTDPRLSACTPSDVTRVRLTKASRRKEIGDPLVAELLALGGVVENGTCRNSGPRRGRACTTDAACDSAAMSGDGECAMRSVKFDPPLDAPSICTNFAEIVVPLRFNSLLQPLPGKVVLGLRSVHPVTAKRRLTDRDSLRLVCRP